MWASRNTGTAPSALQQGLGQGGRQALGHRPRLGLGPQTASLLATKAGAQIVGEVTSGALSPTLGVPISMAYVDPEYSAVGTALHLDVRGTRVPASIVALPFYKREK